MQRTALPTLIDGFLRTHEAGAIALGSAAWDGWLADESNRSFAVQTPDGHFTARRERQRNGWYWYAYRRQGQRVRKRYLGRNVDLTLERLHTVAAALHAPETPLPATEPASLLLSTKLYAPTPRPEQISRPRLLERMLAIWRTPVTLITAPAGFGKTTLLANWVASDPLLQEPAQARVAWVSLDTGDNDPIRLLRYVTTAINELPAGVLNDVLALLDVPQPPAIQTIMAILINALTRLPRPTAIVLDDYHEIGTPEIHTALGILIERMPPHCHLVLASRAEPLLGVARLRARGLLNEVRAADLRFTPDEAAHFLNAALGLPLAPEIVQSLEVRTEGWIAGLQLAALALRNRSDHAGFVAAFAGSHRAVADYLAEEVIRHQPPDVQSFLLRTAILEPFCAELCNAVLAAEAPGTPAVPTDAQAMLELLERLNLFLVPLDDERRWYRYHHLFADMLRDRLQRRLPDLVPMLHRAATRWHQASGTLDSAISHALAAGDYAEATRMIAAVVDQVLWQRNDTRRLLQWLESVPQAILDQNPAIQMAQAWALLASLRVDDSERLLRRIEHTLAPDALHVPAIRGEIASIRSYLRRLSGDIPAALNLGRMALDLIPPERVRARAITIIGLNQIYFTLGDIAQVQQFTRRLSNLGDQDQLTSLMLQLSMVDIRIAQGRLHEARALIEQMTHYSGQRFDVEAPNWAMVSGTRGALAYECNDLATAEQCALETIERGRRWWNNDMLIHGYALLANVMKARGDMETSQHCAERLEQLIMEYNIPYLTMQARTGRAWRHAIEGNLADAVRWMDMAGLRADDDIPAYRREEYLVLARVLIALGRNQEALHLLDRLDALAQAGKYLALHLELLKIRVRALLPHDADAARTVLVQALALAEPGGYVRTFLDEGEAMLRLLARIADDSALPAPLRSYAAQLLAAAGTPPGQTAAPAFELPEPLSAREQDVLRLLASGRTNQEIADQLVVAVSTVRTHLQHIYAKLDTRNRVEALARARELGLLPA